VLFGLLFKQSHYKFSRCSATVLIQEESGRLQLIPYVASGTVNLAVSAWTLNRQVLFTELRNTGREPAPVTPGRDNPVETGNWKLIENKFNRN
jgi:hypothetical protein